MSLMRNAADTIALQSLGWLVSNEELLPIFLGATGASEADMRSAAENPDFLGSVLDFIMMDDSWVVACCDANSIPYERLGEARQILPGGGDIHWT